MTGRKPTLSTGGGTSDARFIKNACPVVELGLVNATMHAVDERVALDDLEALSRIYERALELYFAEFSRRRRSRPPHTAAGAKRRIVDPREIEPDAGATWPQRLRSAASSAALSRPRSIAHADLDQRADHRAHLAVQERQRAYFEQNLVALAPDVEPVERADRRFRLALRVAEGREIVPPDKHASRLVHRLGVEPRLDPPGAAEFERERRAAIDDAIEVVARARAVARVEIGAHALGAEDRDGMGMKQRVEPLAEPERLPVALKIDMRDLAERMHARVRAPGAVDDARAPVIAKSAPSSASWTERPFSCRCQPTNGAPSYSRVSL